MPKVDGLVVFLVMILWVCYWMSEEGGISPKAWVVLLNCRKQEVVGISLSQNVVSNIVSYSWWMILFVISLLLFLAILKWSWLLLHLPWEIVPSKKLNMNWFFVIWRIPAQSILYFNFFLLYKNKQEDGIVDGCSFPSFVPLNNWFSTPCLPFDLQGWIHRWPACSNVLKTSIQRWGCCNDWIWKEVLPSTIISLCCRLLVLPWLGVEDLDDDDTASVVELLGLITIVLDNKILIVRQAAAMTKWKRFML